jgi:Ca-activated chloride channel family protein
MAEIASTSGGESFDVEDADQLDAIYERLGSEIATRPEKREITAGFAAGGMALLVAAAGLSLRAGGRLP